MGTVYLFDSNAPHRLERMRNVPRINIKMMYTPGNDIDCLLYPPDSDYRFDSDNLKLDALSELQRRTLSHALRPTSTMA